MEEKREIIYSDISSASRKQPYDVMVYLEGTSVIAVDSIGKVIAKGTAGTDDATVIQAAIDATPVRGTVEISFGEYTISQVITIQKDLTLRGDNPTLVSTIEGSYNKFIFDCMGSTSDPAPLEIDALPGESENGQIVDVPNSVAITPGMLVILCNDTLWRVGYGSDDTQKTAEIHRVRGVTGTTIALDDMLLHHYEVSNNSTITAITPIEVHISGFTLVGPGRTKHAYAIRLRGTISSTVQNCSMSKFGYTACVIEDSYGATVSNCTIYECSRDGDGYGVALVNATASILVTNCHMHDCRHGLSVGGDYSRGQSRGIVVANNVFSSGTSGAIDAHPNCEDILVYGNIIYYGGFGNNAATQLGSKRIIVSNNIMINCFNTLRGPFEIDSMIYANNLVVGPHSALFSANSGSARYAVKSACVIGNMCYNSKFGFSIYPLDIGSIIITGNVFDTPHCPYCGAIYIYPELHENSEFANIVVTNNLISRCSENGIWIRDFKGSIITDNIICDVSQKENGECYGIIAPSNSRIERNHIRFSPNSTVTELNTAIWTGRDSLVRDNIIETPVISGNSTITYTSPCIVRGNVGYVTENSGYVTLPAGTTSLTVPNGCDCRPSSIVITPGSFGNATKWWIGDNNTTEFTIEVDADPGKAVTFFWQAKA